MTIKEFALLAGVSVSTVSKIMNGKDASISARTREHVLKLAKEYNYVPYASATAPTTRTLTMGVIFQNTEHGKRLVSSILKEATSLGYSLLLRESGDSADTELKNISAMAAAHTDGVIWEPVSSDSLFLGEKLDRAGIPYVVIGPYKGAFHMDFEKIGDTATGVIWEPVSSDSLFLGEKLDRAGIPYVVIGPYKGAFHMDFEKIGDTATGLLVKKRHASIACVAGDDSLAREFFQGYRKRLFDEKLPFRQELVFPDAGSLPVSGILNGLFTAAVFFSQAEALKFYETVRNLQYEIPADLSLLTLRDGSSGGDLPFFSSLALPFDAFGSQAARLLVARIEKWEHMPEFSPDFPLNTETTLSVPRDLQKKRVISIGSVNMDNYLAFDALPHSGRTVTSSDSATYPGGKCLNQAVGVARLGHHVSVIGRVGGDADSDSIYQAVRDCRIDSSGLLRTPGQKTGQAYVGVARLGHHVSVIGRVGGDADSDSIYQAVRDCRIDSSGLLRTPGQKTGQAYIFVQKNGESMISILSGANSQVCPGDITAAERLFDGACCCLIQTEIPMEAVLTAAPDPDGDPHGGCTDCRVHGKTLRPHDRAEAQLLRPPARGAVKKYRCGRTQRRRAVHDLPRKGLHKRKGRQASFPWDKDCHRHPGSRRLLDLR